MEPLTRVTPATVDVLNVLLGETDPTWGLVIIKTTGRPPGTVYPVLERLERLDWVTSEWEESTDRPGPRRRLYQLTPDGLAAATATVAAFKTKGTSRVARVSEAGA